MELQRHLCGLVYSRQFADFLRRKHEEEAASQEGGLMALEYVRCAVGEQAGASWWQLRWMPRHAAAAEDCFYIGPTQVVISRQSRHGLKNHLLHFADGRVQVKR